MNIYCLSTMGYMSVLLLSEKGLNRVWKGVGSRAPNNTPLPILIVRRDTIAKDAPKKNKNTSGSLSVQQGPVVQSVVSLTSSLRVISLTVLAD